MLEFIGFHGTAKSNGKNILEGGFHKSDSHQDWLGKGVYFFEDKKDAEWWVLDKEGFSEAIIIKVTIEVERESLLDLGYQSDKEFFDSAFRDIIENIQTLEEKYDLKFFETSESSTLDGLVINILCQMYPSIKVVRSVFSYETKFVEYGLSRIRDQTVQLAVKDRACIENKTISSKFPDDLDSEG